MFACAGIHSLILFLGCVAYVQGVPAVVEKVAQLEEAMKSIHDWHAVILGADSKNGTPATFFLGRDCIIF